MPDDKKITGLPAATVPLSGSEKAEIVQGGINVQVDVSEFGGGGGGTVTSVTGTASRIAVDNTNPATPVINIDAAYDTAVTNAINAKVADAINDGTTTIAPSQNAVFDALATKQPLDSDLTAIAAITPSNDDVIQRKGGVWTNRTMVQLGADLQQVNIGNLLYLYNNFI